MRYRPGNAQHIGARQEQQDAFAFSDPSNKKFLGHGGLLAVVSDGMGGLSNGQQASSSAVRAFLAAYESKAKSDSVPEALQRGLRAAFEAVEGINQAGGGSGATLVAAVARDNELYWVSVGDSRLYLVRHGHVVQLSRDHSYRERLLDQVTSDQVRLDDAMSHPEREHLTSYLGMTGSPEVDTNVRPFLLEPDDAVFLCTDGVYRALTDTEFASAFGSASASQACEAVKSMVLARAAPQQDNLTIVAFRCEGESGAVSGRPGIRSRIALVAVCLLLCANLFAANLAWHSWHSQTADAGQKKIEGSPTGHETPDVKPSPMPDANKDGLSGGDTQGQGGGDSDTPEIKPAGRDTAVDGKNQKKDHSKSNRKENGKKEFNEEPGRKDTQERDPQDTSRDR